MNRTVRLPARIQMAVEVIQACERERWADELAQLAAQYAPQNRAVYETLTRTATMVRQNQPLTREVTDVGARP